MQQKFTKNQLVKYLYKETSATETLAIHEAINEDWNLSEQYEALQIAKQQLPKAVFQPSRSSIQRILSHSANTAVQRTHH
ncbi:MAG: hypothetical protein AB8G15_10350 [Saprospiraceae bacterium]